MIGLYNSLYPKNAHFQTISYNKNGEQEMTLDRNNLMKKEPQSSDSSSSEEDFSGPIISWNFVSEEESSIYFIIKETTGFSFSVEVEERGLMVSWTVTEPPDAVWQLIKNTSPNITSRDFYRSISVQSGEYFIQSPRLLETHPNLSSKIANDLGYRIIKVKLKFTEEKKKNLL